MDEFLRLKYYLNYQWRAKTKYYLHSPLVYQFYLNVLEGHNDDTLLAIKALRQKLHADNTLIEIEDFGTGTYSNSRQVAQLEKHVAVRHRYGQVLYRLVKYYKPTTILELGCSIGLSSAYMALANPNATVTSLEGATALIELARKNHAALGIQNVTIHHGNFDNTLAPVLQNQSALGLVFFDGNHRHDATLRYFNQCLAKTSPNTIFVFDDIHYSPAMHTAWAEIKAHPQITLALDVFQFGICFFRREKLAKEEFVLRY